MIGRLAAALAAAALLLTACGSSNSAANQHTSCGHSTNGVLCMVVYTGHTGIRDVLAYYSPMTSLARRTWRLDLLGYDCDPASPTCHPTAQYPATARHTPPPVDGKCIALFYDAAGRHYCTSRLVEESGAERGDFAGLSRWPSATLAADEWVCLSAQVAQGRSWHDQFPRSAACYH